MKVQMVIRVGAVVLSAAIGLVPGQAFAFDFQEGDVNFSLNTQFTYGFGIRTKNQSCSLIGDPNASCGASANTAQWSNADNGDLNYKRGQLFADYLKVTSELLATAPDGYKFFTRASYLYDFSAGHTERTDLSGDANKQISNWFYWYDIWGSKDFTIGDQQAHIRVGNQVINWGESIFAFGGINASNSYDYQKLLVPGTQIKEALLPAPMISFATGIANGLNTEMYYQFRWNRTLVPPVGTYFSNDDLYGRGYAPFILSTTNFNVGGLDAGTISGSRAQSVLAPTNQNLINGVYSGPPYNSIGFGFGSDITPKNTGQWGINLSYNIPGTQINVTGYYENYHDKVPVLLSDASGSLQNVFLPNRHLFGLSTNFPVGDWAIGGELSYRPRDAIALSTCYGQGGPTDANTNGVVGINCPLYIDKRKFQTDLTALLTMAHTQYPFLNYLGADVAYLTAELTWIDYPGVGPSTPINRTIDGVNVMQVPDAVYGIWLNKNAGTGYPIFAGTGTASSIGLAVDFNWTYDGTLIKGWQVTPGATLYASVHGDTPTYFANYLDGARAMNFYVLFNQNPTIWQAGLNYTAYWGGSNNNSGQSIRQSYADRNFIGGFITRNF
jgi:hypothetical protein